MRVCVCAHVCVCVRACVCVYVSACCPELLEGAITFSLVRLQWLGSGAQLPAFPEHRHSQSVPKPTVPQPPPAPSSPLSPLRPLGPRSLGHFHALRSLSLSVCLSVCLSVSLSVSRSLSLSLIRHLAFSFLPPPPVSSSPLMCIMRQ